MLIAQCVERYTLYIYIKRCFFFFECPSRFLCRTSGAFRIRIAGKLFFSFFFSPQVSSLAEFYRVLLPPFIDAIRGGDKDDAVKTEGTSRPRAVALNHTVSFDATSDESASRHFRGERMRARFCAAPVIRSPAVRRPPHSVIRVFFSSATST